MNFFLALIALIIVFVFFIEIPFFDEILDILHAKAEELRARHKDSYVQGYLDGRREAFKDFINGQSEGLHD